MQIRVTCPECGKSFQIPGRFAGRDGECSNCQAVFQIPRHAERIPATNRKPNAESSSAERPSEDRRSLGTGSRAAPLPGVTEEISIYSVEPSDEFDARDEIHFASAEPVEPPVFDITEADLLPDDEASGGDASFRQPNLADGLDDAPDTFDERPAAAAQPNEPPASRRHRQPSDGGDAQQGTRWERRRRKAKGESFAASGQSSGDHSRIADADDLDEGGSVGRDTPTPMLRRRRSNEEDSRPESSSRRGSSRKAALTSGDDQPAGRRPKRQSNPRQLAIVGGAGAVLLLGAVLYSHFSAPAAPVLPVVLDSPAPPSENPPPENQSPDNLPPRDSTAETSPAATETQSSDAPSDDAQPDSDQTESGSISERELPPGDSASDAPETSSD